MIHDHFQDRVMARFEPMRTDTINRIADAANCARSLGHETRAAKLFRVCAKLNDCVRSPTVITDAAETRVAIAEMRCKHRLCPRCNRSRLLRIRQRLEAITMQFDACRMVTLTLAHSNAPLADQLALLRKAFGRLRRRKSIAHLITGGVYTIEITFNHETNQWHPHLHAILDGQYIPHQILKREWTEVSNGATIVDIRHAYQRSVVVGYITKYVSKGIDTARIPTRALGEYVPAISSMRLVGTFGHAHGWQIEQEPRPKWLTETHYVCHYDGIMQEAIAGDQDAAAALEIVAHQHQNAAAHMDADGHVHPPPEWSDAAAAAVAAMHRIERAKFDKLLGYTPHAAPTPRAGPDPCLEFV